VPEVFDALGDPVRRRILELLAAGEQPTGALVTSLRSRLTISQPAVSQHLRVLREAGLVSVRAAGTRRFYAIDPAGVGAAQAWLARLADPLAPFAQPLDALATELARGRRADAARPGQPRSVRPASVPTTSARPPAPGQQIAGPAA
jgi:DNA-binding transcriptional ArsR family regulator